MLEQRPAGPQDEALLLAWRNDPDTRRASFREDEVEPEDHHRWLAGKLADPACAIAIFERGGVPVAQVRLDRVDPTTAEVDVAVAPAARGGGIGTDALRMAAAQARAALGVSRLVARIKPENERSMRAFAAAGFTVAGSGEQGVELQLELP